MTNAPKIDLLESPYGLVIHADLDDDALQAFLDEQYVGPFDINAPANYVWKIHPERWWRKAPRRFWGGWRLYVAEPGSRGAFAGRLVHAVHPDEARP